MSAGRIDWTCDACGEPVEDATGYVWVDVGAVRQYESAVEEWNNEHARARGTVVLASDETLASYPARHTWKVHHNACDGSDRGSEYWIGVEGIRTWVQLLHWTTHLWGKDWAHHTKWDQLIRRAIGSPRI